MTPGKPPEPSDKYRGVTGTQIYPHSLFGGLTGEDLQERVKRLKYANFVSFLLKTK